MLLKPLADRLVVKVVSGEEKTKSGLYLPDTAQEKPQEGEVIAVGNGRVLDNGQKMPLEVKVGDRIIFSKYSGTEIKLGDEEYIVVRQNDILAIVE